MIFPPKIEKVLQAKPDIIYMVMQHMHRDEFAADLAVFEEEIKNRQIVLVGAESMVSRTMPDVLDGMVSTISTSEAPESFLDRFEKEFKYRDDQRFSADCYDMVYLYALAATATDGNDPAQMSEYLLKMDGSNAISSSNWKEIKRLLQQGELVTLEGGFGPIVFDENGDTAKSSIKVMQIKTGQATPVN